MTHFLFLILLPAVVTFLPFILERPIGLFWMAATECAGWVILSLTAGFLHAHVVQAIYLILAAVWAWITWKNRHKRRKMPLVQKLGYKTRALLEKLVAGMPKPRRWTAPAT